MTAAQAGLRDRMGDPQSAPGSGLRSKLEDNPGRPRHLLPEPGMGYRYQP